MGPVPGVESVHTPNACSYRPAAEVSVTLMATKAGPLPTSQLAGPPDPVGPRARLAAGLCRSCPTPRTVLASGKTSALWCAEHLEHQRAIDKASWRRRNT